MHVLIALVRIETKVESTKTTHQQTHLFMDSKSIFCFVFAIKCKNLSSGAYLWCGIIVVFKPILFVPMDKYKVSTIPKWICQFTMNRLSKSNLCSQLQPWVTIDYSSACNLFSIKANSTRAFLQWNLNHCQPSIELISDSSV